MPRSREDWIRILWLVFAGACGALDLPAAVAASRLPVMVSPDPGFDAALTLLRFAALWIIVGLIAGFVMQSQPLRRSFYLMLSIVLAVLACPTVG